MGKYSRRAFLNKISSIGLITPSILNASSLPLSKKLWPGVKNPFTILFQGDSITDGNRGRNDDPNHIMGHGYAFSIASRLGADFPDRNLKFINKGISGNTIKDLAARWQEDTLDLKPDVISILVGVNDVYFQLKENNSKAPYDFEVEYRKLLALTIEKLPSVLFAIGSPFILPVGMINKDLARWNNEIQLRQQAAKKLAHEFDAVWVDYQHVFSEAAKNTPAEYWIWDGIHPTVPGHELMARAWITEVSKRLTIIAPGKQRKK